MSLENYAYIRDLAIEKVRVDGRKPDERRQIKIKTGVINHSDGSACVELGKTKVLAGVKLLPGIPFPDRPNEGGLIVNFEASELASNYPSDRIIYSVEVGRVTDRGIRESNIIDLKKLVVEPGKTALFVYVDCYAINNDGNLLDACNIACLTALVNARCVMEGHGEERLPLPLNLDNLSISHTFGKIDRTIFFDPDMIEENIEDARLTIGAGNGVINSMQKGKSGAFTPEEVDACVERALAHRHEVKDLILGHHSK